MNTHCIVVSIPMILMPVRNGHNVPRKNEKSRSSKSHDACVASVERSGGAADLMAAIDRYTVDGSEIWRSPVEVGSLSRYLQGFSTIPGG